MTDTNFVIINSKFRAENSKSTADFIYSLGESMEVSDIAVKSVSIINAEYNIKVGHNTLIVSDGTTETTLTFTVGQYTITELLTDLQTKLTATYGITVTCVLDGTTKKVIITSTTPIKFKLGSTSKVAKYLGLGDSFTNASNYYPEVQSSTINALYFPALQGANNYHIASATLAQGKGSLLKNNEKKPIIISIPVNEDFGNIINYEVNEIKLNQRHFPRPINIQDIDIRVIDDDNEIVDLGNTDVEIVLQILHAQIAPYSTQGDMTRHY